MGGRRHRLTLIKCRSPIHTHGLMENRVRVVSFLVKCEKITKNLAAIPLASVKTRIVASRHIPFAAHDIVDMLTKCWGHGSRFACTEAELICGNKVLGEIEQD